MHAIMGGNPAAKEIWLCSKSIIHAMVDFAAAIEI